MAPTARAPDPVDRATAAVGAMIVALADSLFFDIDLDAARTRLMAHGLLAHLHERDPLARPDKAVDHLFAAYLLGAATSDEALDARLTTVLILAISSSMGCGAMFLPAAVTRMFFLRSVILR